MYPTVVRVRGQAASSLVQSQRFSRNAGGQPSRHANSIDHRSVRHVGPRPGRPTLTSQGLRCVFQGWLLHVIVSTSSSSASMTPLTLSRMVLIWGTLLWAICANALCHMSSGCPCTAKVICMTPDFSGKPSISLLDEDPHVLNLTMDNRHLKDMLEANSCKLNPICPEGSATCVHYCLTEAKDKKQGRPESPQFLCCHKQSKGLLQGDAAYTGKAKRIPRRSKTIGASGDEGPKLSQALQGEDLTVLSRKFWPIVRDDLVQTSIHKAANSDLPKNDNHAFETALLEGAQVPKQNSVQLIGTRSRGLSKRNVSYSMRDLLNRSATSKAKVLRNHVQRNIQLQKLPSLRHKRKFPIWRRQLLQAVPPVAAPAVAPAIVVPPDVAPAVVVPPVVAPPVVLPVMALAPYRAPDVMNPPPPYTIPPPPLTSAPTPFPPPFPSIVYFSPPPPPPPSPPIVYLDFPPDEVKLMMPTINAPSTYSISNVSVFITGVDIKFINITPSSILLLKVATLQTRQDHVVELPRLHDGRQNPRRGRRLFQAAPTPVVSSGTYIKTSTVWVPKTTGVSTQLFLFLQVNAGSLVVLLPGYLLYNAKHQPTLADEWVATMNSSDPWVWVPGAGIQFLGTVEEINAALSTLMFGLGLGTGKAKTVQLLVLASHTFVNLTPIDQAHATKIIALQVAGAGAWFTIFTYTKNFYQSSVGVLCFFAMLLILLCCILGCCLCHDARMEKVFQQNKTVLKAQNAVFNETRVFNPVWIPSAAVLPGREKMVVIHNPKFLQQRLAQHLSSLHGAVVDKVVSVVDFRRGKAEERVGLNDDGSDSDAFSNTSTGASMSDRMSQGSAPATSPAESCEEGTSPQSTHYTINDDRKPGSPLSGRGMSPGSDSTHYDIGSPGSSSDDTESVNG